MRIKATLLAAVAIVAATAASAQTVTIGGISSVGAVPSNNNYQTDLAGLGLTQVTADFTSITLSGPARISFGLVGAESALYQQFRLTTSTSPFSTILQIRDGSSGTLPWTPPPGAQLQTVDIASVAPGSLPRLAFSSFTDAAYLNPAGTEQFVPDANVFLFLPTGFSGSSYTSNQIVFGFDDVGIGGQDRDFDDLLIVAQVSPIPEPETWALMILGFGMVGAAMRRRKAMPVLAS